jgi:DNA primase
VHIYVRLEPRWTFDEVPHAAIGLGRELARRDDGVTTAWWKEERGARLFLDYNQNLRDRTIASAWSLRARPGAPVSTPLSWDQLADVTDPRDFNLTTVPDLLSDGDPWAAIDTEHYSIEPLLQLWESLPGGELNWPPDYPKQPGEPPRVQPSKKVAEHWDDEGNRVEK